MTAVGGISSHGSDTSSQEHLSSAGSYDVITDSTSPSFHSVSSTEDDIASAHSNSTSGQGEGHHQLGCTNSRRLVDSLPPNSSFSSVRLYTNPPALRFNPQDIHKSSTRSDSSRSSTPPTPKSGGSVHSDVYSTVFALHSLGDGNSSKSTSEYLNKVRALWDGHMQHNQRPLSTGGLTNRIGSGSGDFQRHSLGQGQTTCRFSSLLLLLYIHHYYNKSFCTRLTLPFKFLLQSFCFNLFFNLMQRKKSCERSVTVIFVTESFQHIIFACRILLVCNLSLSAIYGIHHAL